jgi:single-stranded DNA-binding protein
MENTPIKTNSITIEGKICSDFELSHEVYGEKFYSFYINNKRLSDTSDILPVIISERLLIGTDYTIGDIIKIDGQIRSFNNSDGIKTHLMLNIFVKNIEKLPFSCNNNENFVMLNGYICKAPIFRTTPFGRKIADVLLAVNRAYGKSDYIPTICWGRNAKFVTELPIGSNISIYGRMQSREYQKRLENGECITKTAYEVSISKLEQTPQD